MFTVEESVLIRRPRAEVWRYLVDPARMPDWEKNLVAVTADWQAEPAVGDQQQRVMKLLGRTVEWTERVSDVVSGELYATENVDAPFSGTHRFRLEEVDGGTTLTVTAVHGDTSEVGGLVGRLSQPMLKSVSRRLWRSDLRRLKAVLE